MLELWALTEAVACNGIERVEREGNRFGGGEWMTQQELDELPIAAGKALYQPDDEPAIVTDAHGESWLIGYSRGVRYKRRMNA